MTTRSLRLLLLTSFALFAVAGSASAAPADLDPSFGSGGVVALPAVVYANRVAASMQSDGKTVIAYERDSDHIPELMRINSDGSVDGTFGAGGKFELPLAGGTVATTASVIAQSSGRILVGGTITLAAVERMIVWAVTPTGALDTTFNPGVGYRVLPVSGTDGNTTAAIGVQPDGDIAVVASTQIGGVDGIVLQFASSAGLNEGSTTKVLTDAMDPSSVAIQPDGGVVVAAVVDTGGTGVGVTQRFTEAGVWDAGFAGSGFAVLGFPVPIFSQAFSVKARPDGSLITLGQFGLTATMQTLLPSGLANMGLNPFGISRQLGPHVASIFSDGAIVGGDRALAAGITTNLTTITSPFVARFDANGAADPTFAAGTITGIADKVGFTSVAVQPDGHYLVFYVVDDSQTLKVARLMGDFVAAPVPAPLKIKFNTIKSTQTASKFKKFSGTASGTGLAKVQIAILKVDSKLLKKSKKCAFVKSSSGATKAYKAVKGKCMPTAFLGAKGTTGWSYSLKKSLPPGKYKLYARATGTGGAKSALISKSIALKKKK